MSSPESTDFNGGSIPSVDRVRNVLLDICDDLGFNVSEIVVYGSFAKGSFSEDSDLDVLIISEDFEGMGFYDRVGVITFEWRDYALPDLDPTPLTPEEYEESKNDESWLIKEIEETGEEIYA